MFMVLAYCDMTEHIVNYYIFALCYIMFKLNWLPAQDKLTQP